MKIVVVGAGLIGSGIANAFARQGHFVTVLAPRRNPAITGGVGFVHGRVSLGSRVADVFNGAEVVVDAASASVPAAVQGSPAATAASCIGTSAWVAEQAVEAGMGCIVYLSSGGTVYGPGVEPHREDASLRPVSSYGAMKLASEVMIGAITRGTATRAVYLRVSNAYGPGQNLAKPQGIIGVAWRNFLDGRPTVLSGAPTVVRDFVFIDDVGNLCVTVADSDFSGALNAASGRGVSLEELLKTMSDVAGTDFELVQEKARDFDVIHSVLDISTARGLGWEPRVPLREGLRRTWRWIAREDIPAPHL